MGYMDFKNSDLEKIFKNFKWARNNTILIFKEAQNFKILGYKSSSTKQTKYSFQPLIYQFQCIITTTDTYYRKMTGNKNNSFGILVDGDKIILKKEIKIENIENLLDNQIVKLQVLYKTFDSKTFEKNLESILSLSNHEYLHQGQMIIDFRESGVELPERYRKAWAL